MTQSLIWPRIVALLALISLGCSSGATPEDGAWDGEHIAFTVINSQVHDIRLKNVECSGTNSAGDSCGLAITDQLYPGQYSEGGSSFNHTFLDAEHGYVAIRSSAFVTPYDAKGTIVVRASGCCEASVSFTATTDRPIVPEDTTTPDTATPPDSGAPDPGTNPDVTPTDPCAPPAITAQHGGCAPEDASTEQVAALSEVNKIRGWIGIKPVNEHSAINIAATEHCNCFVTHYDTAYANGQMSAHSEDPNLEGCYGASFADRMAHFGYGSGASYEIMTFMGAPKEAVHGWAETLYHRIPIVDPNSFETGYGLAFGPSIACDTMNFSGGQDADPNHDAIYPFDGQVGVGISWDGYESPQPPVPPTGYPSGPIITITTPNGVDLNVQSQQLLGPGDVEVPIVVTGPSDSQFLSRTTSIYAHDPLEPNTTYTVKMSGKRNSQQWERTWSFTTGTTAAWQY